MKCQLVLDSYTAYTDYDLTATMRAEIENHLKQCRKCHEVFQDLNDMVASLNGLSNFQVSSDFNDRLFAKIARVDTRLKPLPWYRLPTVRISGYATAAGVALALVFSQWMSPTPASPSPVRTPMPVAGEITPKSSPAPVLVNYDSLNTNTDTLDLLEPLTTRPDQPLQLVNQRP